MERSHPTRPLESATGLLARLYILVYKYMDIIYGYGYICLYNAVQADPVGTRLPYRCSAFGQPAKVISSIVVSLCRDCGWLHEEQRDLNEAHDNIQPWQIAIEADLELGIRLEMFSRKFTKIPTFRIDLGKISELNGTDEDFIGAFQRPSFCL